MIGWWMLFMALLFIIVGLFRVLEELQDIGQTLRGESALRRMSEIDKSIGEAP